MIITENSPLWRAAEVRHTSGFSLACPRCSAHAHFEYVARSEHQTRGTIWRFSVYACASCQEPVTLLAVGSMIRLNNQPVLDAKRVAMIEPRNVLRPPPHQSVPLPWRDDYVEAASIQSLSPKSAAALLRRIVDGMLREKTAPSTIFAMVEALRPPLLPDYVWNGLHDLREMGNWSAHPKWSNVGEIVEVDVDEVSMCFDVVDQMFEHWYVGPWRENARKERLAQRKADGLRDKP